MRIFKVRPDSNHQRQTLSFPSGDGSFSSLSEALAEAGRLPEGEKCRIELAEGVYQENVSITRSDLEIVGADRKDASKTVITGHLGAYEILEDGLKRGTFRTQTVFLHADRVTLRDLTIENTAGPGRTAGQAIALYADGDLLCFENLRLSGWQDTLFTGPLPEHEIEKGGFRGPLEHAARVPGRHIYRRCRIEGNIDFIFGGAAALFEECQICVRRDPGSGEESGSNEKEDAKQYYITAASTPKGQKAGYVFFRCHIGGDCPEGSVFLGRPWRDDAQTAFLECTYEPLISPARWHDWGKRGARTTIRYGEYNCRMCSPGGPFMKPENEAKPAEFAVLLTQKEADELLAYFHDLRI